MEITRKQAKEILKIYLMFNPVPISDKTIVHKSSYMNTINTYTYGYIKKIAEGKK